MEGLGLNYQEYILALSTMFARTADETLKFAFEIIDSDGSGEVEIDEFCGLVKAMMARTQQHLDADSIEEVSQREFAAVWNAATPPLLVCVFIACVQLVTVFRFAVSINCRRIRIRMGCCQLTSS